MAENKQKIDDIIEANDDTGNMYAIGKIALNLPKYVMPKSGSLHFECSADDAINVIHEILQNNKVSLNIQWTLMGD